MKLWIDDIREAPLGYVWVRSVNQAKRCIIAQETMYNASGHKPFYKIDCINIDHDAGEFANDGGDFIKLLDWLEENHRSYPIHIHSMNPVGVENMKRIIKRNNWKEI